MAGVPESMRFLAVVDSAVETTSRTIVPTVNGLAAAARELEQQDPDTVQPTSGTARVHETILDWLDGRTEHVSHSRRPIEHRAILTDRLLRAKVAQRAAEVFSADMHLGQAESTRAGVVAFQDALRITKPRRSLLRSRQ